MRRLIFTEKIEGPHLARSAPFVPKYPSPYNSPRRDQKNNNAPFQKGLALILSLESEESSSCSTSQQSPMQSHKKPQVQLQIDIEIQLKASQDVAMAIAVKEKLVLHELKRVKAALAFANERAAWLEEEHRILKESLGKGDNPEDDDMIRLQLETLLAEKAQLAQENSSLGRENNFLQEIIEYYQLTTEVYRPPL